MENNKITISAIFIATYTTLLFAIPQASFITKNSTIGTFIYTIFIVYGIVINLYFFFYIIFSALEISSLKNKSLPMFDIDLKQEEVVKIRERFFNHGIYLILFSFPAAISGLLITKFLEHFHFLIAILIYSAVFVILSILLERIMKLMAK